MIMGSAIARGLRQKTLMVLTATVNKSGIRRSTEICGSREGVICGGFEKHKYGAKMSAGKYSSRVSII